MRIAVIGSGGVGGYFGGKLAKAGHEVTFVARGEHLKAIQQNGLTVKSINGDFNLTDVSATVDVSTIGKVDLVLLCVKAWQVKDVGAELHHLVDENTPILPLQNGILATEELSEFVDKKHILVGLCRIISKIETPGIINHFAVNPSIVFGDVNGINIDKLEQVKAAIEVAEIDVFLTENILVEQWKKFVFISSGSLLAITKSSYGVLRDIAETRTMFKSLLQEGIDVAAKLNINLPAEYLEKTMAFIDAMPYDANCSLARDFWEGKPSEIEYQSGTIVKLGKKHNLPTPTHQFIYNCLLPMEQTARNKS